MFSAQETPFEAVAWGLTKVLVGRHPSPGGEQSSDVEFKITEYAPRYSHERHAHAEQCEIVYVLSGQGEHETADGRRVRFGPGDIIYIPAGCAHGNHNPHDEPIRAVIVKVPG